MRWNPCTRRSTLDATTSWVAPRLHERGRFSTSFRLLTKNFFFYAFPSSYFSFTVYRSLFIQNFIAVGEGLAVLEPRLISEWITFVFASVVFKN